MGLFDNSIGRALGLSGSEKAGSRAADQLAGIGAGLRNFKPIRFRSAMGTGTYDQNGVSLDLDPRLTAGAGSAMDFFGSTSRKLAAFDEGDATARTLELLRQRRATQYNSQLGSLESRLMQQGRLGLSTGARAENPELASFFGAEAMADLEAQLMAAEEARRERSGLLDAGERGLALASEASMPSQLMSGLFNTESLRSARDFAAANIEAGGPAMQYKGAEADLGARANFFGSMIQGGSQMASTAMTAGLLSDRRLKRNIRRVGTHPSGVGVYEYEYLWGGGPTVGVMADEVKQVMPGAVISVLGFDAVDYSAL